ncbi:MAG: NAD(P)H-dependent oxidoreductase [Clostridia bacterium]|nr:NAD(P)H-dependent oxidoreductase [Clostridia bacterium]
MILFVNVCVRENSRTLKLAEYLLKRFDDEIIRLDLEHEDLKPLNRKLLAERDRLISEKEFSSELFRYAKQFAKADTVVIAAPYWDLSFPALLKIYMEQLCVLGVTFQYSDDGRPIGLCKADRMFYVTTAGGEIPENNFGFDYIKLAAKGFFGISEVTNIKAEKLDIYGMDTDEILKEAMLEIDKIKI